MAIAVHELLDEIRNAAITRARVGDRVRSVRMHQETFQRVVDELSAKVESSFGVPSDTWFTLHTAAGSVRVSPGSDADVVDHLYFDPPRSGAGPSAAGVPPAPPDVASPAPDAAAPVELVEVYDVARPRMAPVEYVGRAVRAGLGGEYWTTGAVSPGDVLIARPDRSRGSSWRTGRAAVGAHYDLRSITAICEGDHVYRIGKPTMPSLEERVAMLERLVHPDLIVADDAEKSGRPAIAAELRAKYPWWRDPGGDR